MIKKLDLRKIRKELHQIAEVSEKEIKTSEYIYKLLSLFRFTEIHKNIGGNGILAIFKSPNDGPNCLFRAELDALPIEEINTFEHKSLQTEVSHKCGHDGHMTILVGFIERFFTNIEQQSGSTMFLFQPAEENGVGAKSAIQDFKKLNLKIDYAFALHNIPGFEKHQVYCKENEITPAVFSVILKLYGKTAHAAEPENGINPSLAISDLIKDFDALNQPNQNDTKFTIFTPIHIEMGEIAYGISAGYGEVHYTVRCWTNTQLEYIKQKIELISERISKSREISISLSYLEEFKSNQNNKICVQLIKEATLASNLNYNELSNPFKWGEDFGVFTENYKGALFGLGAGLNIPTLHNPDYDFPEELIETGIQLFNEILSKTQNKHS